VLHAIRLDRHWCKRLWSATVTEDKGDWLTDGFEAHRPHLRAVAYRMLGSTSEADDAVQEAWLRLSRSGVDRVQNLRGWLTTVVGRICLDMLRSRTARREAPLDEHAHDLVKSRADGPDPEQEALIADSVGLALLVVLDTLSPAERLAFVLHDMFSVPFDEIAPILERTPDATKMLASRARQRLKAADTTPDNDDPARHRAVVHAFLAAARRGDFRALLALLHPDVVLRADRTAIAKGAPSELRGAADVARRFSGRAQAASPALIDGAAGAVWAARGRPLVVFDFTIAGGKVVAIELIADPHRLRRLDLSILTS
jgi:RNA polymerase sigma factor (sigma-70 family)